MLCRHLIVVALFLSTLAVLGAHAAGTIDLEEAQRAYAANNSDEVPLVSWMLGGIPRVLVYSDGSLIVSDRRSKSGLVAAHLSDGDLSAALKSLSAQDGFWLLSSRYKLTKWSDQDWNIVSVRIPSKAVVSVSVYGNLKPQSKDDGTPPPAFTQFVDTLTALAPEKMQPWDPGYVEILWAEYDYAPDQSLPWPKGWPGFDSPLVRPMTNAVIKKIMVFPSSQLTELDAFLARRPVRGAILIDGKKMSASYRWPLRGEKKWSSWKQ